jgi:hypothetical protein
MADFTLLGEAVARVQGKASFTICESLALQVDRACISGRSVFVGLDYTNIGEPQQQAVKPLVYGIGDSERLFVNHLMTCTRCKPASRTYCADGLQLKANA